VITLVMLAAAARAAGGQAHPGGRNRARDRAGRGETPGNGGRYPWPGLVPGARARREPQPGIAARRGSWLTGTQGSASGLGNPGQEQSRHRCVAEGDLQVGVICVLAVRAAAVWAGVAGAGVSEVDAAARGVADGGLDPTMTILAG
jgi:hypothetical protein